MSRFIFEIRSNVLILFLISGCSEEQPRVESVDIFIERGLNFRHQGQYDKAIEINTGIAEAYINRGAVYQVQRQYDRAISDFNKDLEINPKDAMAYNNWGLPIGSKVSMKRPYLTTTHP